MLPVCLVYAFFDGSIFIHSQNVVNLDFCYCINSLEFTLSNKVPNLRQIISLVIAQSCSIFEPGI